MKDNLVALHRRGEDGKMRLCDDGHVLHRPLVVSGQQEEKEVVNAGGHGLFCVPSEYSGKLYR